MKTDFLKFTLGVTVLCISWGDWPSFITRSGVALAQRRPVPQVPEGSPSSRPGVVRGAPRVRPTPPVSGGDNRSTQPAVVRGNCGDKNAMMPILPRLGQPEGIILAGSTLSNYPRFFIFIPPNNAEQASFTLQDDRQNVLYTATFKLRSTAGIASIALPNSIGVAPLMAGKTYRWTFAISCPVQGVIVQESVSGLVLRVEPSPALASRLATTKGRARFQLLYDAGFWYDALATLADLRQVSPNDELLFNDWSTMFRQTTNPDLRYEPLIQSSETVAADSSL